MSGPLSIGISTLKDTVTPRLKKLRSAMAEAELMRNLGEAGAAIATRAFREDTLRPLPWPPHSPRTHATWPLLMPPKAHLWRSIRVTSYDARHATVGTDRPYAPYLQFGTRKMPARPFLPFFAPNMPTPMLVTALQQRAEQYLRNVLGAM